VHNPPPRYNAEENESSLSLFQGQFGSASDASTKTLQLQEWRNIMLYVLTNLTEVEPYMGQVHILNKLVQLVSLLCVQPLISRWCREFLCQYWSSSRPPNPQQCETLLKLGAGNSEPDFISWFKQKVLFNLART
jgi:hypothetical protein